MRNMRLLLAMFATYADAAAVPHDALQRYFQLAETIWSPESLAGQCLAIQRRDGWAPRIIQQLQNFKTYHVRVRSPCYARRLYPAQARCRRCGPPLARLDAARRVQRPRARALRRTCKLLGMWRLLPAQGHEAPPGGAAQGPRQRVALL